MADERPVSADGRTPADGAGGAGGGGGGIVGIVLAGGQARRMGGGDKVLKPVGDRPMLARILDRIRPQVDALALNANGDPARFAAYGLPVVPDPVPDHPGPLAGVLAGLDWARRACPDAAYVATVPGDAPFLPRDLVARLAAARAAAGADMACAASGGREHPVFGLWPVRLADELRHALTVEEVRKVDVWTARYRRAVADFPAAPLDPFFNANSPADIAAAERMLARYEGALA